MSMAVSNYQLLLDKLHQFKRKFYLNQMLRGAIYFVAFFAFSFLLVNALEYYGQYSTTVRTVLFWTFVVVNAGLVVRYLAIPLMHLLQMGKTLSDDEAAVLIGKHFPEVKDKLLNTLQLHRQASGSRDDFERDLILASINQKTDDLKPVPFSNAIDFGSNRKYLRWAAIPAAALLIILITSPDMILQSSERLIRHQTYYEPKAPFQFVLENDSLKGIRQEDFTVRLKLLGEEIPAQAYIVMNGQQYRMDRDNTINFTYQLHNLQKDVEFQFGANGFVSRPYSLEVLAKPLMEGFEVALDYPDYLGKKDETLENTGDLSIPQGTEVTWNVNTAFTNQLTLHFEDTAVAARQQEENRFVHNARFMQNARYWMKLGNPTMRSQDSIVYFVNVIPDTHPTITVQEEEDTASTKHRFFTGEVSDDYGLSALTFSYRHSPAGNNPAQAEWKSKPLKLNSGQSIQSFYHFFDLNELNLQAGDQVEYFFTVWDNDAVNGRKSTRSRTLTYLAPSKEQLREQMEESNEAVKEQMQAALRQAAKLQRESKELRQRLLEKKSLSWEDQQRMQDLMKQQEQLQQSVENLQQEYKQNMRKQEDFREMDPELMEKHKQLQKMMDEVLTDEMKELMKKMEELMDKNMKDELQQQLEQMDMKDQQMEKEMDRMLELFKKLEMEQQLEEMKEQLEELAEEQEKLAEESENAGKEKSEELAKKQKELNKEFEEVKKGMEEVRKKNQELEQPQEMESTEQEEESVEQEMQESQEQLQQKQNKKASESQKKAAQKMRKMQQKMEQMQANMEMKGMQIDYQALRQILENLIAFSFEQEQLMDRLEEIRQYNPKYVELAQEQSKLRQDFAIIEDSLIALSKRVFQIESFITKELSELNFNMEKTVKAMGERQIPQARNYQQYVMTNANNLAVMLSEVLQQMQQQMASQMSGSQQCQKPNGQGKGQKKKGGGPSLSNMKQLQEQLNKQMEQLKKGGKGGQGGMSKQMAQMAAMQERIRQQMREMENAKRKGGQGAGSEMQKLQELMEQTEKDLVNKRLTEETLRRQEEIMVKLLEAEKAEREQEWDNKRESQTADNQFNPADRILEEYKRKKMKEVELLQTVPPSLNTYYKQKVKTYFENVR